MTVTLKSRIPLIVADLSSEVLEAVVEGAEEIAQGAKDRVPVAEGTLRDAIHVEVDEDESRVSIVAGNTEAFYGHIIEHGSVKTPPRPFLTPAYEAGRDGLLTGVADVLEDL